MSTIQFTDSAASVRTSDGARALARAAVTALGAPSILNSQPWHWRVSGDTLQLLADRTRQIADIDPEGRLLTVSCGAALHHVRVALAADGVAAEVEYHTDGAEPDLLATIRAVGVVAPTANDTRLYRAISLRRSDRRPFSDAEPASAAIEKVRAAAEAAGAHLHVPGADDVVLLSVAAGHAATVEQADPAYLETLARWVRAEERAADGVQASSAAPSSTVASSAAASSAAASSAADGDVAADGVPAATAAPVAARPVPLRDFTATGPETATVHDRPEPGDRAAVYGIVMTDGDTPRDWLAAGEALSAVLLTAAAEGLAASPMSDVVEVPASRHILRRMLSGVGAPQIAVRLGVPAPGHVAGTPRRPADETVEVVGE